MNRKLFAIWLCLIALTAATARGADETIRWVDYVEGKALALTQGKTAIVYFHTAWCPSCRKMEAETFSRPEVIRVINEGFIAIGVDADAQQDIARAYGVSGVPDFWLIRPDAAPIGNVTGFIPPNRLLKLLDYHRR